MRACAKESGCASPGWRASRRRVPAGIEPSSLSVAPPTNFASPSIVGSANNSSNVTPWPTARRNREINRIAIREWPPRLKKLSVTLTLSKPSNSRQRSAIWDSSAVRGSTHDGSTSSAASPSSAGRCSLRISSLPSAWRRASLSPRCMRPPATGDQGSGRKRAALSAGCPRIPAAKLAPPSHNSPTTPIGASPASSTTSRPRRTT